MFTARWRLLRVRSIPIYVDASWLIILALVTWMLGNEFHQTFPDLPVGTTLGLGLAAAVSFFLCIVLHELGHAIVGRAEGMSIRGITLFLFGGVAELESEPRSAGAEFAMAIAGPVVSAILALLFWLGARATPIPIWEYFLGRLALINLVVLVFNLVPAFPLDGGRVLRSALWAVTGNLRRATRWASLFGQIFAWLLVAWGVVLLFSGFAINGIFTVMIGFFLNSAARSSYRSVLVRQLLEGEPVRRFMNPDPIAVSPMLDLRTWVEDYVYRYHRKAFPVVSEGRLVGIITTRDVAGINRADWDRHTVSELMRHDFDAFRILPNADALEALQRMQRTGSSRLLVTEGDQLRGIVSLKDLLRFLSLKMELEGPGDDGPRSANPWPGGVAHREETVSH
jgi:Zn-dependent protease/predicted transcriptional regulator